MKARYTVIIAAIFLIATFAIINNTASLPTINNNGESQLSERKPSQPRSSSGRSDKKSYDDSSPITDRQKLLNELQREWLQLETLDYWNIKGEEQARREDLAYRSIMGLGLSSELFALSNFIAENGITVSSSPGSLLSFYFRLVNSGEIEISHSDFEALLANYRNMGDLENAKISLGFLGSAVAQKIESHDEFENLYAKLLAEDERMAQTAAFVFYEGQALNGGLKIDKAISAIAGQKTVGGDPMRVDQRINSLIANYLNSEREFNPEDIELIEKSIADLSGHPHFSERAAMNQIMLALGRHDPTEAMNQVIQNTDRYPVESAKYISVSGFRKIVSEHGEQAAMDWLRGIPEGPHRVQAIIGAFDIVHENKSLAREVANLLPASERGSLVNMAQLEHHDDS